jgi:hypothetical protein
MQVPLYGKIGLGAFGSVVVAVALLVVLTFLKANDSLVRMTEGRHAFVASTVQTQLQTGLDLGLELAMEANAAQVIGAVAAANPLIRSIEVFDEHGKVLFAAGPAARRAQVPPSWRAAITRQPAGSAWSERAKSALVTGLPLVNDFGKTVGGLAVSYSRAALDAASRAMLHRILAGSLKVLAIALLIMMAAVLALLRHTGRSFRRATTALETIGPGAPLPPFTPDQLDELELATERFRGRVAAGWAGLEDAGRRLDALGG